MPNDFLQDPFWYKDAVIYELHVRSFFDANNDGYGDFEGLRRKLPYLESLGVNTLWLLPFLESPLRDDGYDIADYFKILPVHGGLEDFKDFLDEAHERGMRVITELVLNHTSDQHPWFQEARDPNSPKHNWYVWSETTERYQSARIIFTDTEVSNWTWDRKAQKYFWHRFFSHQPDLNYDNPEVREAMKEVMFFWFDLGVDGLRLDAVPYLYEREGTSCENLPETIGYIKELRAAIEERYGPGRVLLAEANQWPEDTLPYFADGEGVQMSFNFPIMPRMFMALRRENRRPLIEMLEMTKGTPEDAQWAIFLRNHDELTLEMVTDEERDYMYHEYANDPRFRINVGIRRRLAPLLGGERRRIELMNALLLSMKGSPVLYYGDEIAMGDDPFLGDRNGVRTPMQWSDDKNGGFSRAPHHRLFMPPIDRGPYSYEFVNVEDAEQNPHSLLNFMKRLLSLRQQHVKVFGRGSFELIPVENQSVLVFVRQYEDERILVVANLSRFAQSVHLPVDDAYADLVPVELFSQAVFPKFEDTPYHLILGPHNFFWFALKPVEDVSPVTAPKPALQEAPAGSALPELVVAEGIQNLLVKTMVQNGGMEALEHLLPAYLERQRWFGAKSRGITSVRIEDAVRLKQAPHPIYLSLLHVAMDDGTSAIYVLPLTTASDEQAEALLEQYSNTALAWVRTPRERSLLYDAAVHDEFWKVLLRWWQQQSNSRSLRGLYMPQLDADVRYAPVQTARLLTGEQSNSAAIIDDRFFAKLYRRLEPGPNPEAEVLGYLTQAGFKFIPRLHGTITFKKVFTEHALAILQEALPVEEDGWAYAQEMTRRFLSRVSETRIPEQLPSEEDDDVPVWLDEVASEMLSLARVLGIRTAELHLALSHAEARDLRPVESTPDDLPRLLETVRSEAAHTRRLLADRNGAPDDLAPSAAQWDRSMATLDQLTDLTPPAVKTRVHGDYHLGQVLRADGEFYILDFEGEPARSLEERRSRDFALRDVAGMLRSLEYAVLATWQDAFDGDEALEPWATLLVHWCEHLFLEAYFETAEDAPFLPPQAERRAFLWPYLLSKALYEVRYELNHRPTWTWLPLRGLRRLMEADRDSLAQPLSHEEER